MLMHDYEFRIRKAKYTRPAYIGKPVLVTLGILALIVIIANSCPF